MAYIWLLGSLTIGHREKIKLGKVAYFWVVLVKPITRKFLREGVIFFRYWGITSISNNFGRAEAPLTPTMATSLVLVIFNTFSRLLFELYRLTSANLRQNVSPLADHPQKRFFKYGWSYTLTPSNTFSYYAFIDRSKPFWTCSDHFHRFYQRVNVEI